MKTMQLLVSALLLSMLAACGGGGGGGGAGVAATQGSVSGIATKGPMNHATVTAYAISNGQMGAQIGTATTDANGNFSMPIGNYSGSVMLQLSGGGFTDEATGANQNMANGDVMTTLVTGMTAGGTLSGIQITPLTSMAQAMAQHMSGGMTDANIAAANTSVGTLYSVSDVIHTQPMNPLVSGSGTGASQSAQNYGMVLAAMSQYAHSQGLAGTSALVTAMMNDASDGTLDGKMGSTAVMMGGVAMPATAGTGGMAGAMVAFMASAQNKSGVGVSAMQSLMNQLNGTTGQIGSGPMQNGTIGGSGTKGPVSGATVTAYAISNGTMGAQLGTAMTDANGNFNLPVGSYAGAVMLKLAGGTYLDEATGSTMSMASGDVMTAVLTGVNAGSTLSGMQVTPLTSMAQAMAQNMPGGMADANITAANAAVGKYFSVSDILTTPPINPLVSGSGSGATASMQNYGMALAAMSQYGQTMGLSSSSAVVTAMMNDAADGVMNGMNSSNQVSMGGMGGSGMGGGVKMQANAGASGLATAMTTFMNSGANKSGLTPANMNSLVQQLMGSNGRMLP